MNPGKSQTRFFKTCLGVFQGGGCRAAAFVGAYEEAVSRGVHFAEVAGTSAGSIAAALIGAGADAEELRKTIGKLVFSSFLVDPDPPARNTASASQPAWVSLLRFTRFAEYRYFFSHLGLHSSSEIERWLEAELRRIVGINRPVKFKDLLIPTWIVAADLRTRSVQIWSSKNDPEYEVAHAVRASCSIPVFFQPVDSRLVDGGTLSNLPSFVFKPSADSERPLSSRILAFTLEADEEELNQGSAFSLVKGLLNTAIDGGQALQLTIQSDVHVVPIQTGKVKATDFDKITPDTIATLVENGQRAASEFFDDELFRVRSNGRPTTLCDDEDQMYSAIVDNLDRNVHDILIAEPGTRWVYSLYPALLSWRKRGVRIRVCLEEHVGGDHDLYRRRLLAALGIEVFEVPSVPVSVFLFDAGDPDKAFAVVRLRSSNTLSAVAIRYYGVADYSAIDSLRERIDGICTDASKSSKYKLALQPPALTQGNKDKLLTALSSVSQYDAPGIDMSRMDVELESLISLTRHVREYKYKQIGHLIALYKQLGLRLFEPTFVDYGDGRSTIITPPVVEKSGDRYVLIQGTTRAVWCRDNAHDDKGNKIDRIDCIVVQGGPALPSDLRLSLKNVRIAGRELSLGARYGVANLDIREVENRVHPIDELV